MKLAPLVLALALGATSASADVNDLEVVPIADGVWVHTTRNPEGIPGNGMLVKSGDGIVLVDTPWTDEQTNRLLGWVRDNLKLPVTSAVVTHSHIDSMGGIGALLAAKIPTGTLDITAEKARADGRPVPDVVLTRAQREVQDPRGIVVFYPGPGHTTDTTVVYVPAAKALFGGCLVKSETAGDMGYVGEADLGHWPAAIRAVQARFPEAQVVVPGHGPVGGPKTLTRTLELLAAYQPDLGRHFESRQLEGAVLVSEEPAGRQVAWGGERLEKGFLPASTFKILNSLIALEEGVIADERATFTWDGKARWVADWNRDHDLASAFRTSAVWYFQELARRIGLETYRSWLARVGYGNHDVSGGLETFWLEGGLRITPRQQLDFLRRLHARDLPFSKRAMDTVVRIMKNEERADAVVFSKTGWTMALGPHHAWNVGWVERGGRTSFFVIQLEAAAGDYPMFQKRKEVTEAVLRDLAVLPAP